MSSVPGIRRLLVIPLLALPFLVATASSAAAQVTEPGEDEEIVVLNGGVHIAPGEEVGDVVVLNGAVRIEGTVFGDVFVLNGATTIAGEVTGDVMVMNGAVAVMPGARIGGDLVTGGGPTSVSPQATIEGERRSVDFGFLFGRAAIVGAILVWLAVALSALALGMLFVGLAPRAAEAVAGVAHTTVGPAIGWGFALFFGIPVGAGIAIATLVGIPLGVATLLFLVLLYPFAGVVSAYALGRRLLQPPTSRYLAYLLGWAILAGVTMVPFVGGLAWLAAIVYGLGSIAVAVWRARRAPTPAPVLPAAMPPPPSSVGT